MTFRLLPALLVPIALGFVAPAIADVAPDRASIEAQTGAGSGATLQSRARKWQGSRGGAR